MVSFSARAAFVESRGWIKHFGFRVGRAGPEEVASSGAALPALATNKAQNCFGKMGPIMARHECAALGHKLKCDEELQELLNRPINTHNIM